MESYIVRQQIREINRKLFANDMIYSGTDRYTLEMLIANIVQQYNPEDELAGVPTVLEVKSENFDNDSFEKLLLLNNKSVIIQLNSIILTQPEKVNILKQLKEAGYKIIIEINKEDTVFTLARIFADIVKFDIQNLPESIFDEKNRFNCKKLAYNVNSPDDYVLAEQSGIDYYEGTYISPATNIEIEDNTGHSKVNFIEIIAMINSDKSDSASIARVIARDSLMSAQIIRLSNSVYFGSRYRIESIDTAVTRVGMDNLKRWVFLLQFNNNSNVPEELLQTSYHRAVFCERIIKECKKSGITSNDAYMIGLFSTLDILTGRSIDIELSRMNLSEIVEDALIYRDGVGGTLLNLIRAYEDANWKRVDKYISNFKLNKDKINKIYYESIDEVAKLWKSLTEYGDVK